MLLVTQQQLLQLPPTAAAADLVCQLPLLINVELECGPEALRCRRPPCLLLLQL